MVILYKREDGTNCACDRAEALTPLFDNCDT